MDGREEKSLFFWFLPNQGELPGTLQLLSIDWSDVLIEGAKTKSFRFLLSKPYFFWILSYLWPRKKGKAINWILICQGLKKESSTIPSGSGSKKIVQKHPNSSLKISFFWNHSQQQQLVFSRYKTEQTIIKFLFINSLRSKLNAHLLLKLKKFFLFMKLCSNTFQSLTFLIVQQTLQFILICIRK